MKTSLVLQTMSKTPLSKSLTIKQLRLLNLATVLSGKVEKPEPVEGTETPIEAERRVRLVQGTATVLAWLLVIGTTTAVLTFLRSARTPLSTTVIVLTSWITARGHRSWSWNGHQARTLALLLDQCQPLWESGNCVTAQNQPNAESGCVVSLA